MFTGEYEMSEFDLGNTFNYAEMAALIAPRPFMVERGHDDGVGIDEWVAYEYAKVRRLYARLKLPRPDRDRVLRRRARDQRRRDVRVPGQAPELAAEVAAHPTIHPLLELDRLRGPACRVESHTGGSLCVRNPSPQPLQDRRRKLLRRLDDIRQAAHGRVDGRSAPPPACPSRGIP